MQKKNLRKTKVKLTGTKPKSMEAGYDCILDDESRFDIVEAYKAARTSIMYSLVGDGAKVVCLTSPSPSEGKTTSCINLAITFAQTGAHVLIIDGDMRKPRIHRCLNLFTEPGLSNVLGGFNKLSEAIQKTDFDNLEVITCGHLPPNPVELLGSENMEILIDCLKEEYDYIFIDSPPINTVTDVAVLSKLVSGLVIVVRFAQTTYEEIHMAVDKLKLVDSKILGFLLNDVKEKNSYYKKSYYKKGYYKTQYGDSEKENPVKDA